MDYNQFSSCCSGNSVGVSWGQSGDPSLILTSAAAITSVTGYTNNVSSIPVQFVDAPNYDYRPTTPGVNIGQDLSALTNNMPGLDMDSFGNRRGAAGNWSAGAIDYRALSPTPPSILAQPINQANTVGANVVFAVGAIGSSPLNYQWWFNGAPVPDQLWLRAQ